MTSKRQPYQRALLAYVSDVLSRRLSHFFRSFLWEGDMRGCSAERRDIHSGNGVNGGPLAGRLVPRRGLRLGLVGGLLALPLGTGLAQTLPVQVPASLPMPAFGRLSVRPRAIATGTRTERAGTQEFQVRPGRTASVYVPPTCAGTRRCPLILCVGSSNFQHSAVPKLADRYGLILLDAPWGNIPSRDREVVDPGVPTLRREVSVDRDSEQTFHDLDSALTWMLRTYAIDPEKIAIFGNSAGGFFSDFLGSINPDVFSRIAPRALLGSDPFEPPISRPATTQFYFAGGLTDFGGFYSAMGLAVAKRRDGYPVKIVLTPTGHSPDPLVEFPHLFRWFHDSWAAPDSAARAARPTRVAPMPLLTADALARWTAFWTRFMQEPDAIRDSARVAHTKEVPLMIGQEPVVMLMTDLPVLAARYPALAADLKAAGLTARHAEAYRIALLSAWATLEAEAIRRQGYLSDFTGTAAPTSVLGRNVAFLRAQPAEWRRSLARSVCDGDDCRMWTNTP